MAKKSNKKTNSGNWALKSIGPVAYVIATAVGYFYSSAYYDSFGVNFQRYVSPLELLLAGVDAMDKVVPAVLIVPVAFILLLVVVLVAFITLLCAMIGLPVAALCGVLAVCAALIHVLSYPIAIVRACVVQIRCLRVAVNDVRADKQKRAKLVQVEAGQEAPQEAEANPLRFIDAYQIAKDRTTPEWPPINPQTYVGTASELLKQVSSATEWGDRELLQIGTRIALTWNWTLGAFVQPAAQNRRARFKQWSMIQWPPRFLVFAFIVLFLTYLFYVANRSGAVEASEVLDRAIKFRNSGNHETTLQTSASFFNPYALIPFLFDIRTHKLPTILTVPTGSLGSVKFDCGDKHPRLSKKGHLIGHATLRKDAGDVVLGGKQECLAYLGATGGMHFFASFPDDNAGGDDGESTQSPKSPSVAERSQEAPSISIIVDGRRAITGGSCELDLAAMVGPFPTGEGKMQSIDRSQESVAKCTVPGYAEQPLLDVSKAIEGIDDSSSEMVVLVGRADIRPIRNRQFDSNMELTRERVNWVEERLREKRSTLRISVLSIPGGPVDSPRRASESTGELVETERQGDDPCSRVVEIYQCPSPEGGITPETDESADSDGAT